MLRIGSIVLRVDDLQRQTEFWQAALGYVRRDDGKSDDFVLLGPSDGAGPHLSLDQVRSSRKSVHASTSTCTPKIKLRRSTGCCPSGRLRSIGTNHRRMPTT